ncbi:flagellar protein FlaG [Shewanella alkalitolerans]|uniref:flagellar protein FlaG n=1 Tax=Shewanella alkalitolerans TaxID=2864209 RepID=UPI0021ABCC7C|nr:flagellar protein FlaG [Shewanella alkalitolerans]
MDVNFPNTSIPLQRKDSLAHMVDKKTEVVSQALADDGIQSAGDVERSVNQVNQVSKADAEELNQAVNDIAASMSLMQKGLAFNIDEDSGLQVVKVIDVQSGDLIRQIPNEEALEIARKLNEVAGLLMKTEV